MVDKVDPVGPAGRTAQRGPESPGYVLPQPVDHPEQGGGDRQQNGQPGHGGHPQQRQGRQPPEGPGQRRAVFPQLRAEPDAQGKGRQTPQHGVSGFQRGGAEKRPDPLPHQQQGAQQQAAAPGLHAPEQQREQQVQQKNDAQEPFTDLVKGGGHRGQIAVQAQQGKDHPPAGNVRVVAVQHIPVEEQHEKPQPEGGIHGGGPSHQVGAPAEPSLPLQAERRP